MYNVDRCAEKEGESECVAGLITDIIHDFNDIGDELFPFSAMHERVDLLVKSRYWNIVERYNAYVYCTDDDVPRKSEIMRCYFFSRRVCSAAQGSVTGGVVGGVVGTVADLFIAFAIGGCSTIILCIFVLILLAIVAAVCILVGATIGGQIGKATAEDTLPTGDIEGNESELTVGDYVTIKGNMLQRSFDNNANVLWWVSKNENTGELNVNQSGRANSSIQNRPSYCEVDDEFTDDSCND